ncbi:hypothetical protein BGZ99_008291 [Dissophora globulifera]|uniref:Uncharacterized protein n=1 Tax=Dissophora globulifera TaxID=979702 RepID=A0A9P6RC58_9FUNG|nr:hypothetical protein BGZ99_008291 [Dissophora globulifera]
MARWAIALYFLELSTSKFPYTKNQIKQVLSDMISKGQTEHLCGSSWIQLIWMYTRMDNEADGPSPRMSPFSYSRIMKGLRLSIQRPQGWFSRSLLTRCLDDVLPWLWRQNWDYDESSVHISNELLQELMLMWLLHWSPDAWKDSSKLIEPDKIVFEDICGVLKSSVGQLDDGHSRPDILLVLCSVIRSMSARLGEKEKYNFIAYTATLAGLTTAQLTSVFSVVISELLRQIENLQTPDRCLEALSSSMQLAMIVVESGQGDIFKDEPQLLPSLWIIIHHLMDEILLVQQSPRSPQRTEIECTVHGLLLLSEASALQLTVFMMSENDLILATYYVLEIRDYQLREGYAGERVAITRLILRLAKQSMDRLAYDSTTCTENRRSDGNANDGHTELLVNLDLLLDALRDDIITTIDSEAVWTSLSEVKASFLGPTEHATTTPAPTTFSLLYLCAPHFLLESATFDMIKHLLLRWQSDATRLLQRYSSSSSMSSCSALMSCTATLTGRSQQEAGIAMTVRGSESADDVCCMTGRWPVRIAQAAADILEILKLTVVVSRSHNQDSSDSTGQIASQTGDAQPDQKASHIVNSKLFSDVATTIQEIRRQSALPENASAPIHSAPALIAALELLSWIQDNARLR